MKILKRVEYAGNYTYIETKKPNNFNFKHGQFTTLSTPQKEPAYFAIASHPQEEHLSFLIKNGQWVPASGQEITMGEAMGNGFDSQAIQSPNLWLITHGSGISAFASLLKEIYKNTDQYKKVRLDYGVRTNEELPNGQLYFPLNLNSIETHFYISQPPSNDGLPENSLAGRMKNLEYLKSETDPIPSVLLIGKNEMTSQVKEHLHAKGIPLENFYANF